MAIQDKIMTVVAGLVLAVLLVGSGFFVVRRQQQLEQTNALLRQTIQSLSEQQRAMTVGPDDTATGPLRIPAQSQTRTAPDYNTLLQEQTAAPPPSSPASLPHSETSTRPLTDTTTRPSPQPTMARTATLTATEATQISREQAIDRAISYIGGGHVAHVSMEDEHGALVYEILFDGGSKVYVDAEHGQVVYAKVQHEKPRLPAPPPSRHVEGRPGTERGEHPEYDDDRYEGESEYDDDDD